MFFISVFFFCQVLGLGTPYKDYSSKTDAYYQFLYNGTGAGIPAEECAQQDALEECSRDKNYASTLHSPIPDDDIVLIMDGFDVLVFPAIVNAAKILSESPKPILFCAERGIYPEFHGLP